MIKQFTLTGTIFLLITFYSFGQTIEIGDDANKIKSLIEWSTQDRTGFDSYGNSKGNNVDYDVKYFNGQITDVIQCYSNQYMLDFRIAASFCNHYMMVDEKLASIITQYEDISTNKLTSIYDRLYEGRSSGDYYFTEDYKHYSKIYLASNGYATVEWGKVDNLPANVKAGIQKKLQQIEEEKDLQIKIEEENKRAEQERIKKAEEERIKKFLAERKVTDYDYSEIESSKYSQLKSEIENKIFSIADKSNEGKINFSAEIVFKIDTNNVTTATLHPTTNNKSLEDIIETEIDKIQMQPAYKENYTVNAKCSTSILISKSKENFTVNYSNNELTLKDGDNTAFANCKTFITSEFSSKSFPDGNFKIEYSQISVNQKKEESLKVIEYKGFGGAQYAFLSVIIPGIGDHFVNRGKGTFIGKKISPWVTTIGTLGFVGAGVIFKMQSQQNYNSYHSATQQTEMNKYYDLANGQNKTSWELISIGGILWAADIYWVIKKGAANTRESREFKSKNGIAFYPSINNKNSLALNLKITF